MIGLLYHGRLEKEKGFDAILEMMKIVSHQDYEFFIFGMGSLEKELLPLVGKNVHYFGWQPHEKIKSYLENIDYCLMPSEFLETFGLSALYDLSWGIPVIGYKKGGLEPFIFPECNLFAYKGRTTSERLVQCVEQLAQKISGLPRRPTLASSSSQGRDMQSILKNYTPEVWYQRFLSLCKQLGSADISSESGNFFPKKVVLVSDFINKVGGIETYLHDVKGILEAKGHQVQLRGGHLPKGWWGRLRVYLGLLLAPVNFRSAWKFKKFLKKEKPDLIWFNSLLRNVGGNVVKVAEQYQHSLDCHASQGQIWMMYHDFGYFYPFPRKLFFIDEVKTPLTFQHFLASAKKERLLGKLAVMCKYLWMKGLVKSLKKAVHLHLVPSEFMVAVVEKSYQLPAKKVKAFNHFMQK